MGKHKNKQYPPDFSTAVKELESIRSGSIFSSESKKKKGGENNVLVDGGGEQHRLTRFPPACMFFLKLLPGNDMCMDCGETSPKWANVSFGVLICRKCKDRHIPLSRRKVSDLPQFIEHKKWTLQQILTMLKGGNGQFSSYLHRQQQNQPSTQEGKYIGKAPKSYRKALEESTEEITNASSIPDDLFENIHTTYVPEDTLPNMIRAVAELEALSLPAVPSRPAAGIADQEIDASSPAANDQLFRCRLSFPPSCMFFLRVQAGNDLCVDCGEACLPFGPQWANVLYGVLVCHSCSDMHRRISASKAGKVLELWTDRWTLPQVLTMMEGGNDRFLTFLSKRQKKSTLGTIMGSSYKEEKSATNDFHFYEERYKGKVARSYLKELVGKVSEAAATQKLFIPKTFVLEEDE